MNERIRTAINFTTKHFVVVVFCCAASGACYGLVAGFVDRTVQNDALIRYGGLGVAGGLCTFLFALYLSIRFKTSAQQESGRSSDQLIFNEEAAQKLRGLRWNLDLLVMFRDHVLLVIPAVGIFMVLLALKFLGIIPLGSLPIWIGVGMIGLSVICLMLLQGIIERIRGRIWWIYSCAERTSTEQIPESRE